MQILLNDIYLSNIAFYGICIVIGKTIRNTLLGLSLRGSAKEIEIVHRIF